MKTTEPQAVIDAANVLIDWLIDQEDFPQQAEYLDMINRIRTHIEPDDEED